MAKINKAALKAYFQTGKIPTQSNFADLIDSVWNWVDCYHLSDTHRVIKNDLVEEHFFYNN